MDHDLLREAFYKGLGRKIPINLRDKWADFIRSKGTRLVVRYEWITDNRFYDWVTKNLDTLEIEDGAEWFGVFIWKDYINACRKSDNPSPTLSRLIRESDEKARSLSGSS